MLEGSEGDEGESKRGGCAAPRERTEGARAEQEEEEEAVGGEELVEGRLEEESIDRAEREGEAGREREEGAQEEGAVGATRDLVRCGWGEARAVGRPGRHLERGRGEREGGREW